jgi:hypothetical protein
MSRIKRSTFQKNHENPTFPDKGGVNKYPQAVIGAGSGFLKVGAGAGAETNSFGSATLGPDPT